MTDSRFVDPARFLRAHHRAILRVGDEVRPTHFVHDQTTGFPVLSVRADVFECDDLALHVPEDGDGALQLHVEATELDPNTDGACDRFLAYHGASQGGLEARSRAARWARLRILGGRFAGVVHDEVAAPNVLAPVEATLCRWLNSKGDALARTLLSNAGCESLDLSTVPTVVGVDQFGVNVRARFGIRRVEFPLAASSVEAARRMIEELIRDPKTTSDPTVFDA